jgi:hypothetical protein
VSSRAGSRSVSVWQRSGVSGAARPNYFPEVFSESILLEYSLGYERAPDAARASVRLPLRPESLDSVSGEPVMSLLTAATGEAQG